jgi:hypothetical protein
VVVEEKMQWWGFSELLNLNPKPGGDQMNPGNLSQNPATVNPKSKTISKKGRKAMKTKLYSLKSLFAIVCLFLFSSAEITIASAQPYACEEDLIEVMFAQDSKVRLRGGMLIDYKSDALFGVDAALSKSAWYEWYRICDVPEERLDEIQARG